LAASRQELVDSVVRQIDFAVRQMKLTPDEAREQVRRYLRADPDAIRSDQVSWLDLSSLAEADAEGAQARWKRLKDEAATELTAGIRAARVVERPQSADPQERAAFLAIVAGLRRALAPRDALEEMLVQQMAMSYEMSLRWQRVLVQRMEEETWQGERDRRRALENMGPAQRERYEALEGWLPPRQSTAEAIEQAVLLADRYQRAFLRLMKAYRDNRRMFGALIVAGGQVNIGEQQVNVQQEPPQPPARVRTAPSRRTASARVRKSGNTA
jgi:hypothetical protein